MGDRKRRDWVGDYIIQLNENVTDSRTVNNVLYFHAYPLSVSAVQTIRYLTVGYASMTMLYTRNCTVYRKKRFENGIYVSIKA